MKVVFLDIDGVLNDHQKLSTDWCGIKQSCVENFNKIIEATNSKVVLSSSWRYMILMGSMTLRGFEQMLLTHGLDVYGRMAGLLQSDELTGHLGGDRGYQIRQWLTEHPEVTHYVVLDDLDLEISQYHNKHFIQTDSYVGLTAEQAELAIKILH